MNGHACMCESPASAAGPEEKVKPAVADGREFDAASGDRFTRGLHARDGSGGIQCEARERHDTHERLAYARALLEGERTLPQLEPADDGHALCADEGRRRDPDDPAGPRGPRCLQADRGVRFTQGPELPSAASSGVASASTLRRSGRTHWKQRRIEFVQATRRMLEEADRRDVGADVAAEAVPDGRMRARRQVEMMREVRAARERRASTGDAACDAWLGGGLALDGLHAFFGRRLPNLDVGLPDSVSDVGWVAPFGCLIHLVRHHVGVVERSLHEAAEALRGSSPGTSPRASMRSAARRLVVWIGKRVCPDPHALLPASEDVVGCVGDDVQPSERDNAYAVDLAGRSVFVDGPGGIRSRSVATGRSAGGEDRSVRQAIERGWCAEEALRQGAADAIVIDGSDLPEVSWRRLHLAAADAAHPALVLVVMPPVEAPGTLRVSEPRTSRLGRCCATRWDVAPMSSCMELGEDGGSGFRWRAVLRHMRHMRHMQHVRQQERGARTTVPREASESGPSERMAAVEGGRITFEIRAPRALHGDAAWHMVHEHLARRRAAAQACASLSQAFPAGREQEERYARSA